jgi:hypothetical protein
LLLLSLNDVQVARYGDEGRLFVFFPIQGQDYTSFFPCNSEKGAWAPLDGHVDSGNWAGLFAPLFFRVPGVRHPCLTHIQRMQLNMCASSLSLFLPADPNCKLNSPLLFFFLSQFHRYATFKNSVLRQEESTCDRFDYVLAPCSPSSSKEQSLSLSLAIHFLVVGFSFEAITSGSVYTYQLQS